MTDEQNQSVDTMPPQTQSKPGLESEMHPRPLYMALASFKISRSRYRAWYENAHKAPRAARRSCSGVCLLRI